MRDSLVKPSLLWVVLGLFGYLCLPWYAVQDGFWSFSWVAGLATSPEAASGVFQAARHGKWWLAVPFALLFLTAGLLWLAQTRRQLAVILLTTGARGLLCLVVQGFALGIGGWQFKSLEALFGATERAQFGIGMGAVFVLAAFLFLLTNGVAARGLLKGDLFVAGALGLCSALVLTFTFFPVGKILLSAFHGPDGYSATAVFDRLFTGRTWSLACLAGSGRCGVAWNTIFLATLTASCCTLLGLAFALIATRTDFRAKKFLRVLTVLPIITPPFVIGLGLILLFGRAGLINQFLEYAFGIPQTRWIYGLQGVLLAQVFAFTPIAFLVLIGVVQGISPSLEEAAQTLRAKRWMTFKTVTWPLMLPGLANAWLIAFIESVADFGNPIVLGGNFGVLSTEIFFSIVGAQLDQGKAASLSLILLVFALGAFFLQRWIVGKKVYTSMTGKGDSGLSSPLPDAIRRLCYCVALPWAALTIVVYAMAMVGGLVETWGLNYTPTFKHYVKAFGIEHGPHGLLWVGTAWSSFFTTVKLASIAAPITATLGIVTAYLIVRQKFVGQSVFEFATMLSFAVPGTVIGVAYILAFNIPPIEVTGTGIVLILCFIFRNMPVGVRAGMAAMSQIDKSLDEASTTLGGRGFVTLRRVILPLLKPAIVGALVYSFVRAVTTLSAVVFLISAEYEMATTYIINRVVTGDYGVAIAYCSVLILLCVTVIGLIQLVVGERTVARRAPAKNVIPVAP